MCHWGDSEHVRWTVGWNLPLPRAINMQSMHLTSHTQTASLPQIFRPFFSKDRQIRFIQSILCIDLLVDRFLLFSHSHYSKSTPSSNSHTIIASHEQKRIDCRYHYYFCAVVYRVPLLLSPFAFLLCFPRRCPWNLLVWLPLPITGLPFPLLYLLAVVSLSNSCTRLRANNNNEKP